MTGGSLGLRTSSYGSLLLQQQIQQQQSPVSLLSNQSSAAAAVGSRALLISRRPGKMMKDKERLVPWIFKVAGRTKVGMLFLCLVSAAVFVRVLYVGKGEDVQETDPAPNLSFSNRTTIDSGTPFLSRIEINSSPGYAQQHSVQNTSAPHFKGYALPPGNPCENFAFPPPPADRKRIGPRPCPVCYLPVEQAIALMPNASSYSPVLADLTYVHEEHSSKTEFGGSDFGGYPSLKQRNESFDIKESMNVHCGFVRGTRPGHGTGFDIDDADLDDMEQCNGIVVASAIFGNFDLLRQPKNISEASGKNVCFFMFLDEETQEYMRNNSVLSGSKAGLWRIVRVRNLPYADPRRNGKIPKLLLHRLFPNARYSIWMDAKLELVVDPYQILERFLWRQNVSFAISKHYRRFDVFVEAEANKAAAKYDNASIDFQINFYRKEGLTPYSDAKLPILSDVPEGCIIIREHIPISNLFSCLWFNEVDRFTSRDQLSFSTVRDKIRSKVDWNVWKVSMFLDCERRNFVVQGYHRDTLERMVPPIIVIQRPRPPPPSPPPSMARSTPEKASSKRPPARRGRGKRRNRKVAAGSTDT
ncbi:putative hexosyltransferase MUCI70 [Drosera capensis]